MPVKMKRVITRILMLWDNKKLIFKANEYYFSLYRIHPNEPQHLASERKSWVRNGYRRLINPIAIVLLNRNQLRVLF